MPVIVTPPASIVVRVGSTTQPRIQSTSTFTGAAAANVQNALETAQAAYNLANTALQLTGGEITGNLEVDGTFTAVVDGGTFS